MSTPKYKGPGQPTPAAIDGVTGWLGGFLGGAATPAYKTKPTAPPAPPAPPCKPCPESTLALAPMQSGDACDAVPVPVVLDELGDAVIPVGTGPITIVINPRA